ncbi:NAPE-hydrolyzing phospholipase D [Niveomyces insectorum RCEF 264]|uniref:NAPE-hydrolyzing phospholipase D n=1 Tax=Niveomyces insectorum RCEF 264 TaxID=1081102 RepID=A0A167RE08_9HYPO|nr:NAPE-hydrolyzing phospholipase D [Niveomyces insectorum RCEF 264]
MEQAAEVTVTKLEGLGPAPEEAKTKPHHVLRSNGTLARFRNPHPSFVDGNGVAGTLTFTILFKLLTRVFRYRMAGKMPTPDTTPPTVSVRRPTFFPDRFPAATDSAAPAQRPLRATWLGHACYYIEFPSGPRVLFDPVFEDRCSPVPWSGPRRFSPAPCVLADLPAVDVVVISHSHYDHLSGPSVRTLRKHHPHAHFFVGLGLARWFRSAGVDAVTELDWWEDAEATIAWGDNAKGVRVRISCLPSQHSSARSLWDRDHTLWCSWAVASGGRSVYFGGDSGYRSVDVDQEDLEARCTTADAVIAADDAARAARPACPDFAHIGRLRGPFDLGLLPIGAYRPRSLFSGMHADPLDAVDMMRDTQCRRALAMHWGTWVLTNEPVLEPPQKLREALRRRGLPETGLFDVCDIGESREF